MPPQEPPLRRTYLLRVWREHSSSMDQRALRIILQEVRSGHREGFASVEALIAYLRAHLDPNAQESVVQPAAPTAQGVANEPDLPPS
jgi:hypothetical protein